jgi:hypothetical protein
MADNDKKDHSPEAVDAASEGMGQAIGGLEASPSELSEFLYLVIKEFKEVSTGATLREAARIVVERHENMAQFAPAVPYIKEQLKDFFGTRKTEWQDLEAEEAKRHLTDDKNLGGTPG